MLIKHKIMRESNCKQLSRYNLLNASYQTTSAAPVTTNCRPTITIGQLPDWDNHQTRVPGFGGRQTCKPRFEKYRLGLHSLSVTTRNSQNVMSWKVTERYVFMQWKYGSDSVKTIVSIGWLFQIRGAWVSGLLYVCWRAVWRAGKSEWGS